MPSGHSHTKATLILAIGTIPLLDVASTLGVLSGLVLSPDQDVDGGFLGFHHLRRIPIIGGFLSILWRIYWYPYSKIVPHRSPISHSILFGTLVRVAYLLLPVIGLSFFYPIVLGDWFARWLIWLCITDALHIIMDWLN